MALVALTISPYFAQANPFNDALTVCSSPRDHVLRIVELHKKGWHLVLPSQGYAEDYGDALAIYNQPKENTLVAWEASRAWSRSLIGNLLESSASIARKDKSLLLLGSQPETGNASCSLFSAQSKSSEDFLAKLNHNGGVRDWGYGLKGTTFSVTTGEQASQWRTDISIFSVRESKLPDFPFPMQPTLTATFITQQVR